jgi:hypothetical protein
MPTASSVGISNTIDLTLLSSTAVQQVMCVPQMTESLREPRLCPSPLWTNDVEVVDRLPLMKTYDHDQERVSKLSPFAQQGTNAEALPQVDRRPEWRPQLCTDSNHLQIALRRLRCDEASWCANKSPSPQHVAFDFLF